MLQIPVNKILFLDIETVSQFDDYNNMPENWQKLWQLKSSFLTRQPDTETPEILYNKAGIYAEFGKIICISCGYVQGSGIARKLHIKSFSGHDEKTLLSEFSAILNNWNKNNDALLCAHNGKEFDYPYLCRRMIINGIPIPSVLNIMGKKPWEVNLLDTMEMWKFGDYKSYTSLNLMAHCLEIPTPKDDIDGSMVGKVYWQDNNLERIVHYCQKDVITLANIYLKLALEEPLNADNIIIK